MEPNTVPSLSDQLSNLSPVVIVVLVLALTLLRMGVAKRRTPWARTLSELCDTLNFVLILAFLLIRPFVAQAFYIPSESMTNTMLVHDRFVTDKLSYRLHPPRRGDVVVFEAPPDATPEHEDGIDFIKRLIGEPGDRIQVKAAQIALGGTVIGLGADGNGQSAHDYVRGLLGLDATDSVKFFPDHVLVDDSRVISAQDLAAPAHIAPPDLKIEPGETLVNGRAQVEPYTREDPDRDFPRTGGVFTVPAGELFMMGDNRNDSEDSTYWGALDARRVVGRATAIFWPPARVGRIH